MRIYTYSVLSNTFEAFQDKVPYAVVIVEQPDNSRTTGYIPGPLADGDLNIGDEVTKADWDLDGAPVYSLAR